MSKAGSICWHDLISSDLAASKKFLSEALGIKAAAMPGVPGTEFLSTEEGPIGGLMLCDEKAGQQPLWVPYIATDDIAASAALITKHGGKASEVVDSPMGKHAICTDPFGATFALWYDKKKEQKKEEKEEDQKPGSWMTGWAWHELTIHEGQAQKAAEFYKAVFNWDVNEKKDDKGKEYYSFHLSGTDKSDHFNWPGGMYEVPKEDPVQWVCYLKVPNVAKTVEANSGAGGKTIKGATSMPFGTYALLKDPQGISYAVWEPPAGADDDGKEKEAEPEVGQKRKADGEPEKEKEASEVPTGNKRAKKE